MSCLSVILCSHNPRENYLRRVLDGLRAQSLPVAEWELLLVDNHSTEPLSSRFDLSWHPQGRHIREEELGLTPARLRGIKESSADILVFVDDDTVLATDYLEQALNVGREWPFIGTWGGSCIPEYEVPLPDWVRDQVWRLTVVDNKEDVWSNLREGFATIPVGAGMCVRKQVGLKFADKCAQKDAQKVTDRVGKMLTGYGDVDIAHSSLDLGLGNGKSTRLCLTHLIPAGRLTLDYFVRHAEGDAISSTIFRASRGLPVQPPKKPTWVSSFRWLLHRIKNRVPREQYEIAKAHQRGLQIGWDQVQATISRRKPGQ